MIDLREPLIPLSQVPDLPCIPRRRGGARLNPATVYRWATGGLQGCRLETVRVGGALCTTNSALLRFFRALAPVGACNAS
jgi:hypothetical protein